MENNSDVDERETANCVQTGNARVERQIKVRGGFQISCSLATNSSLLYRFNRSFGKTIWK